MGRGGEIIFCIQLNMKNSMIVVKINMSSHIYERKLIAISLYGCGNKFDYVFVLALIFVFNLLMTTFNHGNYLFIKIVCACTLITNFYT
jgi:hypothetical protein